MTLFAQHIHTLTAAVQHIEVQALSQLLPMQSSHHLNSSALLIDVREPNEWTPFIIPGARCCPRGRLESSIEALLDPASVAQAQPVYLYCRSGVRSVMAAHTLQSMGIEHCYSVKGGFLAWQAAGLPLSAFTSQAAC